MSTKRWKDSCDNCNTYQFDCHGYLDVNLNKYKVLCPTCAKALGYKLWKKDKEKKELNERSIRKDNKNSSRKQNNRKNKR